MCIRDRGSVDIQGLVAVAPDKNTNALYITWMCASPDNNKLLSEEDVYKRQIVNRTFG